MHLLIPYVRIPHHADPLFEEFTYGERGARARALKSKVNRGDCIFFHTSIGAKKCITAYYLVDRVLDTRVACQDWAITEKYRNPHILGFQDGTRPLDAGDDDVVAFGDPIRSRVLSRPLHLTKALAGRLSLAIPFPVGRSDGQAIGSATRAWRTLTQKDVQILIGAIKDQDGKEHKALRFLSTAEVGEVLERDIEDLVAANPAVIGKGLSLEARQEPIADGRIDLLLRDDEGAYVVVELKMNRVGHDAVNQVRRYVHEVKKSSTKKVRGAIICPGILPAFEEHLRKQKGIDIFIFGWDLKLKVWR